MQKKDAKALLEKYRSGTCTEEEKALLESWYLQLKDGEFDLNSEELIEIKDHTWDQLMKSQKKAKGILVWNRYAAASIVFAILSLGAIVFISKKVNQHPIEVMATATNAENDVAPGGNKATLTLADGTIVSLGDTKDGKIAEAAGINIRKTADGQVVYEASGAVALTEKQTLLEYNQISTPRGGQYQVILPDGTKVWLNAASSLRYPVRFTAQERYVELTGEAYFEVNKQQLANGDRVPFNVSTPTQTVEVLGTHFNINSYDDEATVKTTLLEGAVRVFVHSPETGSKADNNNGVLLKPNQQSVLTGNHLQVQKIDTEEIMAWKNGYFSFEHADLETVMRQLSRWYDVDVVYAGKMPTGTYTGKVYRNMSIAKVLEVLAYAQIDFKIEGKQMIITP